MITNDDDHWLHNYLIQVVYAFYKGIDTILRMPCRTDADARSIHLVLFFIQSIIFRFRSIFHYLC